MDEITKNKEWLKTNLSTNEIALLKEHTTNPNVWNDEKNKTILQNIFNRIPSTKSAIKLYSGGEVPLNEIKFGEQLNLKYFTSSYDIKIAEQYAKMQNSCDACLFILNVPSGSKIICLDDVSTHGDKEREVLLNGDSILYVTNITNNSQDKGYATVTSDYLEYEADCMFNNDKFLIIAYAIAGSLILLSYCACTYFLT